jgi:hypothetical protein
MDDEINKEEEKKLTTVATEQRVGLGVKVVLTVVVLGAIAAGILAALLLS